MKHLYTLQNTLLIPLYNMKHELSPFANDPRSPTARKRSKNDRYHDRPTKGHRSTGGVPKGEEPEAGARATQAWETSVAAATSAPQMQTTQMRPRRRAVGLCFIFGF